ncbi:hypothetical protein DYB38_008141 [Aphanomyces astaci]|uniref:tRNA (guanine(10)-N(2))-methyltransferase TRMT11 N-terminal domain-containing protein n=1 Tax=Aphanomyces astaci TaxID=112090 RepID=A0A397DT58_APHAT|nr:hypothetical protein DYB38_008141 [Aphanomyces astaci]
MPRYVVYFYHRYVDFRFAEFDAVLKMQGIHDPSTVYAHPPEALDGTTQSPFVQVTLPSDEVAAAISARCVLVKGIYGLLASGATYDDVLHQVLAEQSPLHPTDGTWSFWVDCFGLRLSLQEQDARRLRITSVLDFPGVVQLKNAQFAYWLFEDKGVLTSEVNVKQVIFARQVTAASHDSASTRHLIDKHRLKKRKFIGPTSMDHELSLLMANLALVVPSTFVCDPFVGTASVLVACAQFGAMCVDIDPQPLLGTRPGINIAANFAQYDLPAPDLLRWDVAHPPLDQRHNSMRLQFDAIVCDPPYGMRESAQSTSVAIGKVTALPPHAILPPLLLFAATHLAPRGRLVYVMACQRRDTNDYAQHVPSHPRLRQLHVCVQEMTRKWKEAAAPSFHYQQI